MQRLKLSESVITAFIELFEMSRDMQFAIGDKLIELVRTHGDKAEVIRQLSGELGVTPSVLYDYYRVSEKWTPDLREEYQSLDYTIYRNSDPEKDRELLNKAIDEQWTATRFKEEKFVGMREPSYIVGKIEAIITRSRKYFDARGQRELDEILQRLKNLIEKSSRL